MRTNASRTKIRQLSRKAHLWFALAIFLPALVIFASGILLQVKKQSDWVQPPTQSGSENFPSIGFDQVLQIAQSIPELEVQSWEQIDKIDVRPDKGMMKLIASNAWEAQLDATSGKVLQVAYRRSDLIESIHDGSWFADFSKLWVFLPSAVLLFIMWCSGMVLLYTTLKSKYKKQRLR